MPLLFMLTEPALPLTRLKTSFQQIFLFLKAHFYVPLGTASVL